MNTQAVVSESVVNPVAPKATKAAKVAAKPAKPAPKKVGKAAKAAKPAKVASEGGGIALKSICSALKLDPKLARRKLRAAKLDFHGHRERWNFTAKQAAKVREILEA